MARNESHAMETPATGDDLTRQLFSLAIKGYLARRVRPQICYAYESMGLELTDEAEIAARMQPTAEYRFWSAWNRVAQEHMWTNVAAPIDRARRASTDTSLGSLELNPDCEIPPELVTHDIHLQPGGYMRDDGEGDLRAGALYEAGGALYSRGQGVGLAESKAEMVIRHMREWYPDFAPKRILDLGCSAGASTTPYAKAFPDVEIHAIDVAPAMLRYAHARANALEAEVHFHQRNVNACGFEDGSFDLVVSHNLLHEISDANAAAMFAECHRLLAPGGVTVHQDVPLRASELDPFSRFDFGWDRDHNGEVFWDDFAHRDHLALIRDAGFETLSEDFIAQIDQSFRWYVIRGQK